MFHSLTGTISGHDFPHLYLRTGGVEWQLEVSGQTLQECIRDHSGERRIFTYLHHREDVMRLYGFATLAERDAFLKLITVTGIGPKQALKILSHVTVPALLRLLEEENVAGLTRLPGLGTKTAQKIVLQLKGTLVSPESNTPGRGDDDLTRALVDMGFDRNAVTTTLTKLRSEITDEQELFRRAIVTLSGGGLAD